MRSPTLIRRRIAAIEQLPQTRPFDPSQRRDPKTTTSWDIHMRILELREKAIAFTLERELGRGPTPAELGQAVERDRDAREARFDALAAMLAFPVGTPPEQIAAYIDRKNAARARRLADLAIPDNEDEGDDAA